MPVTIIRDFGFRALRRLPFNAALTSPMGPQFNCGRNRLAATKPAFALLREKGRKQKPGGDEGRSQTGVL